MQLTPQQQAVVNHNHGPALVFAVAGAGKTTALEYRIVRLVQQNVFPAQRILAAAYNTAVREELGARLQRHAGCAEVQVMTLHALGLSAVREAVRAGLLPLIKPWALKEIEHAQEQILNAALVAARQQKVPYLAELDGLDRSDFFTWIGSCKGNLFYFDLDALPAKLRDSGHAQQAAPPLQTEWYLPLAQLMDNVQRERGLITFDDQLRYGWEVLALHPALCKRMQQRYDCVLVDEFQDVNLAQYLILDMLTARHRNYMVVGDDDQTIYEWRGANPHFILNFAKAYQAATYVMDENFRCPIAPLTLANAVIRHNRQRFPKTLRLTQGLGGTTQIVRSRDRRAMGQDIAATIRTLLVQGSKLNEIVVLVRVRAQTPPVELALIQAGLPYEVVDSEPFYARWEIQTLISYCRLALLDEKLQRRKRLSDREVPQLLTSWREVYRFPNRYISKEDAERIETELATAQRPVTQTLRQFVNSEKPYLQQRLGELATLLEWLSRAFAAPARDKKEKQAYQVLVELERKLGYCAYLQKRGSRSERGVDEAENVRQFIEEAKEHGTLQNYLVHLRNLGDRQTKQQNAARGHLLTIRTIHSAKGLEWKVVILPSCDDEIIPHRKSDNVEAERRLLYVALTRTRRDLYIYHLAQQPSTFLGQARWDTVLQEVSLVRSALDKPTANWSQEEVRAMAESVPELGLLNYLQQWHPWSPTRRQEVTAAVMHYVSSHPHNKRQQLQALARQWADFAQGKREAASVARPKLSLPVFTPPAPLPPAHAPERAQPKWEAYNEVEHEHFGRGIIISTADQGRDLKVSFPDGTLRHFRDDDPLLRRA